MFQPTHPHSTSSWSQRIFHFIDRFQNWCCVNVLLDSKNTNCFSPYNYTVHFPGVRGHFTLLTDFKLVLYECLTGLEEHNCFSPHTNTVHLSGVKSPRGTQMYQPTHQHSTSFWSQVASRNTNVSAHTPTQYIFLESSRLEEHKCISPHTNTVHLSGVKSPRGTQMYQPTHQHSTSFWSQGRLEITVQVGWALNTNN